MGIRLLDIGKATSIKDAALSLGCGGLDILFLFVSAWDDGLVVAPSLSDHRLICWGLHACLWGCNETS